MILRKNSSDHDGDPAIKREENTDVQIYTVLKGALFALLFSLSALLPSYAAITADGPGSGVAGPRETVPEEGAQTEALWQDPASPHPLEMEVVYGYDNTARSGRILPMTIRVTNSTKEDFTGTLRAANS